IHRRGPLCGKPAPWARLIYSDKKNTPPVRTGSVSRESTGRLPRTHRNGLLVFLLLPARVVRAGAGRRVIGILRTGRCSHLAVAFEEHTLVDDQTRGRDVAFDMRAALELDLVGGGDVTDELAADDGVLHLDLRLDHTRLADNKSIRRADRPLELAVDANRSLKLDVAFDFAALAEHRVQSCLSRGDFRVLIKHGLRLLVRLSRLESWFQHSARPVVRVLGASSDRSINSAGTFAGRRVRRFHEPQSGDGGPYFFRYSPHRRSLFHGSPGHRLLPDSGSCVHTRYGVRSRGRLRPSTRRFRRIHSFRRFRPPRRAPVYHARQQCPCPGDTTDFFLRP